MKYKYTEEKLKDLIRYKFISDLYSEEELINIFNYFTLPPKVRKVVHCRFVLNQTNKQITREFGIPLHQIENAVKDFEDIFNKALRMYPIARFIKTPKLLDENSNNGHGRAMDGKKVPDPTTGENPVCCYSINSNI